MNPAEWTPRELWHSFVSLLSDNGMSIEEIADPCGHSGTSITGRDRYNATASALNSAG
jgi:hypothetical protein